MSESKKAIVGVADCWGKVCQGFASGNEGDRRTSQVESRISRRKLGYQSTNGRILSER